MKKKYLMIAAIVAMPALAPAQASAHDTNNNQERESFYYGLSKDGYRVVIAYGGNESEHDRDSRHSHEKRNQPKVRYVTYVPHDQRFQQECHDAYVHKTKSNKYEHKHYKKNGHTYH